MPRLSGASWGDPHGEIGIRYSGNDLSIVVVDKRHPHRRTAEIRLNPKRCQALGELLSLMASGIDEEIIRDEIERMQREGCGPNCVSSTG